ncbi:glycosyltransferase family 25 protein [Aeromonas hydrophila]|uniref:Glycosyltransferase family 25 protein n=1 Tax=Aeromonas hydrophila TaxID=644 RepID=A0A926FHQ1_AERHY|nr:glycosyltransferase family 25 protein [Aeromonas hydrophila]
MQYVPGLRHRLGWVGCGLSYKFLINRAKDLNFQQITICEDDVSLPDDFRADLIILKIFI